MEQWDLYDDDMRNTGIVISSDEQIPDGCYHLSVEVWIINEKREVLLLKKSLDYSKIYPGSWGCLDGNVLSNENVNDAINRIINTKLNSNILLENISIKNPVKREQYKYAYVTCILFNDLNDNDISFNEDYISSKFVNKEELTKMCNNGEVAYYLIERINNEIIDYID